jgi:hypothetical protein
VWVVNSCWFVCACVGVGEGGENPLRLLAVGWRGGRRVYEVYDMVDTGR